MSEKVLITGASAGIGAATARLFAEQGDALALVARRSERLDKVATLCREAGAARVEVIEADLSNKGTGVQIVEHAIEKLGDLDVLICNAGYGVSGPSKDVTPEQAERIWQVNFQSQWESIHTVLPRFSDRGGGRIVLVSSIVGKKGLPYSALYSATKFAQIGLGEALWGELRPQGVHISVVCPGYTVTEFQAASVRVGGIAAIDRPIRGQSPTVVAAAILEAVRSGRREVHLTLPGKALLLINRFSEGLATRILAWLALKEREQK